MHARVAFATLLIAVPAFAQLPWELLKDRSFRTAYYQALGPKRAERWLAELPGPGSPATTASVNETEYLVVHSCRPHACDTHNLVLLYSPTRLEVVGKLSEVGKTTWLGKPSAAAKVVIEGAYASRFGGKS